MAMIGTHRFGTKKVLFTAFVASGFLLGPAASVFLNAAQAQQSGFETYEPRPVSAVIGEGLVSGPHYRLAPMVKTVGYFNDFYASTDYGAFEAGSNTMLRRLVREINAIAVLQGITVTDAYTKALEQAALGSVRGVQDLVTNPVQTVQALPHAAFDIFGRVEQGVETKIEGNGTSTEDSGVAQTLQMSSYKRDYAKQLGVDVYSSNPVLQKQLDSVAWAAAAGGLTVSAASMASGSAAVTALSAARNIDEAKSIVASEPPSELTIRNRAALQQMGIEQGLGESFLAQKQYSPRAKTILTTSLAAMPNATGRENVLAVALDAPDEVTAMFYQEVAEMLNGYDERIARISHIERRNRLVIARDVNGKSIVLAPLDYIVWSQQSDPIATEIAKSFQLAPGGDRFELWMTGTASPRFKERAAALGIVVREGVAQQLPLAD
jgi:hypothetical protein